MTPEPILEAPAQEGSTPSLMALLAHRERQIAALRRVGEVLSSQTKADDTVRETLAVAVEVLEADAGSLQMYDAKTECLIFRFVALPEDSHLIGLATPISKGIAGKVFRSGVPDLAEHVQNREEFNPDVDRKSGLETKTMLTAALKRPDGQAIGVVQVLNTRGRFDEHDLEVLEILATQAAIAIETARLVEQARKAEIVNVLGDISHDIKNMLTPIQSGVMTLLPIFDEMFETLESIGAKLESGTGDEIKNATAMAREDYRWILENALDSSEKLQDRTKEIADAVKGELASPVFEEADVNQTAREVCRGLRPVAESANLSLKLELDFEIPKAQFDRKQLYNALYNLVNNAIPETPSGGSITVRTRNAPPDAEKADALLIEVQDTGGGMPENVRARLFTDEAISTKPGGTGLGTRIVANVVRRHNGTISVQSEAGQGSTFSVRLPLRQMG